MNYHYNIFKDNVTFLFILGGDFYSFVKDYITEDIV